MRLRIKYGVQSEFEIEADDPKAVDHFRRSFVRMLNELHRPPKVVYVLRETIKEVVVNGDELDYLVDMRVKKRSQELYMRGYSKGRQYAWKRNRLVIQQLKHDQPRPRR